MEFSASQERALDAVGRWINRGYDSNQPFFYLSGWAGTGKTSLAKHLVGESGLKVFYAAFTGKAAHVLAQKGCTPASTIHSLIYVPSMLSGQRLKSLKADLQEAKAHFALDELTQDQIDSHPDVVDLKFKIAQEEKNLDRPMFKLNYESSVNDCDLLVVDECSMIGKTIAEDLLSFGVPILVLGDPFQLPPVGEDVGYFNKFKPDHMLEEIHRQARDNPIIQMATDIRLGGYPKIGKYGESEVHAAGSRIKDIALAANQIISGRNTTRTTINNMMRRYRNFTADLPQAGERVICLRNNHEIGLLNGQIWTLQEDATAGYLDDERHMNIIALSEDNDSAAINVDVWKFDAEPDYWEKKDAESFDYGYCITGHKSQGSQWPHVVVIDESGAFGPNAPNWLYTVVTRASERVDIVGLL